MKVHIFHNNGILDHIYSSLGGLEEATSHRGFGQHRNTAHSRNTLESAASCSERGINVISRKYSIIALLVWHLLLM